MRAHREGALRRLSDHPRATPDDALAAYRCLLDTGIRPKRIALFGDSAGGALALGTLVAARDLGLAQPGATVLYSPGSNEVLLDDATRRHGRRG